MTSYIKIPLILVALSVLMTIYWIVGLMIGNSIFPNSLLNMEEDPGGSSGLILLLTCALNAGVVLLFIHNSNLKRFKLALAIVAIVFGIQFFMSQIETLWFNDSLNFPVMGVWAIMSGGALMALLFAFTATWITGNFQGTRNEHAKLLINSKALLLKRIGLAAVVFWPLIYFSAGYFIAWQFAEVRQFYSGNSEMASFASIMIGNVTSGLYFFQIIRGLLWVSIALLVLSSITGSTLQKGIVLGLLLSILGSSQLLLPNPYMSETVRIAHLIETATSSFVWGIILSYSFNTFIYSKSEQTKIS